MKRRRPKLSNAEAGVISRDLVQDNRVSAVIQRMNTENHPMVIIRSADGRWFTIANDDDYRDTKAHLETLR